MATSQSYDSPQNKFNPSGSVRQPLEPNTHTHTHTHTHSVPFHTGTHDPDTKGAIVCAKLCTCSAFQKVWTTQMFWRVTKSATTLIATEGSNASEIYQLETKAKKASMSAPTREEAFVVQLIHKLLVFLHANASSNTLEDGKKIIDSSQTFKVCFYSDGHAPNDKLKKVQKFIHRTLPVCCDSEVSGSQKGNPDTATGSALNKDGHVCCLR